MAEVFSFRYNGKSLRPSFRNIEPGVLTAKVAPREKWQDERPDLADASLAVFRTPLAEFTDLEKQLAKNKGAIVKLGELPTLVAAGQSLDVELERDAVYDILALGKRADGTGGLIGGGRYAVRSEGDRPQSMLTLDETKFLGAAALGLDPEQAERVQAEVVPMTAWGNNLGRVVIAGYTLGDRSSKAYAPGITVEQSGAVDFYHGRTAIETRELAGISR